MNTIVETNAKGIECPKCGWPNKRIREKCELCGNPILGKLNPTPPPPPGLKAAAHIPAKNQKPQSDLLDDDHDLAPRGGRLEGKVEKKVYGTVRSGAPTQNAGRRAEEDAGDRTREGGRTLIHQAPADYGRGVRGQADDDETDETDEPRRKPAQAAGGKARADRLNPRNHAAHDEYDEYEDDDEESFQEWLDDEPAAKSPAAKSREKDFAEDKFSYSAGRPGAPKAGAPKGETARSRFAGRDEEAFVEDKFADDEAEDDAEAYDEEEDCRAAAGGLKTFEKLAAARGRSVLRRDDDLLEKDHYYDDDRTEGKPEKALYGGWSDEKRAGAKGLGGGSGGDLKQTRKDSSKGRDAGEKNMRSRSGGGSGDYDDTEFVRVIAASPKSRLAAFALDALVVIAMTFVFLNLGLWFYGVARLPNVNLSGMLYILGMTQNYPGLLTPFLILFLVIAGFYFWAFNAVSGETPGKILMGIRAIRVQGEPPGPFHSLMRVAGMGIGLFTLGFGPAWLIWDQRRQGLHDKLAGTLVIRGQALSAAKVPAEGGL